MTKDRQVVAEVVPADLMKLYDKLRAQQGGSAPPGSTSAAARAAAWS